MSEAFIILILIVILGMYSDNIIITGASLLLLFIKVNNLEPVFPYVLRYGFSVGLFLMILTVMVPLSDDRLSLRALLHELLSPSGLASVFLSAASSYLARYGIEYLKGNPETLIGLIVGTVLGTLFLGGIPTGPLIAAGLTAVLAQILR